MDDVTYFRASLYRRIVNINYSRIIFRFQGELHMYCNRVFQIVFALSSLMLGFTHSAQAQKSFWTFETEHTRPLALSPDGTRLFAVNTPDNRLEIYDVTPAGLSYVESVPVGMEPTAVAARSNTEVWVVNHLSDSASIVDVSSSPARVVRTILLCDEPRDIVFAGSAGNRAFITTARRGQNCPIAPNLTTEGIGRALVQVFDANSLGATAGGTPIANIVLFGDTPRALAKSADGATVYAAVFHSGNNTTTISEGAVCNGGSTVSDCALLDGIDVDGISPFGRAPGGLPAPNDNAAGVNGPEVGLIVKHDPNDGLWKDELGRNWTDAVRFDLPDQDVFEINANGSPPAQTDSFSGVGTVLLNMLVDPNTGNVYVTNTEAVNEVRFEGPGAHAGPLKPPAEPASVIGHLHEARVSIIDSAGDVTTRHLNKHIDYDVVPAPLSVENASLATPMEMALHNGQLYVAAFGSSKVGVFDAAALEADTFVPSASNHIGLSGGGASGIVIDTANQRLYVSTRFDNGISVVDISSAPGNEIGHQTFFNPEPAVVVDGRPVLYDARLTSSNGEASCSSCHVFGNFDSLAWDLGDPDGGVASNPNPIGPIGNSQNFHPNKGPMTTQSLRGMDNHGPMHWRGDRTGGNFVPPQDPLDERLAFIAFNVAFPGLIGNNAELPQATMEAFTDFILEVVYPPNPIAGLDNTLSSGAANGSSIYFTRPNTDVIETCNGCHVTDVATGFFGSNGETTFENETQEFKIPHLRNMYQKVGMFGMPAVPFTRFGDNAHQGDQVRAFGFLHDGSFDTLFRFHTSDVFINMTDPERRDVETFMMEFPAELAPIVGQQITLADAGDTTTRNLIQNLFIDRAEAARPIRFDAAAHECDLIVKGHISGEARGAVYDTATNRFIPDRVADPALTATQLFALAGSGSELTFTCVPPGAGVRMGIDRNENSILDGDEATPAEIDHYLVYKGKTTPGTPKFAKLDVSIDDPTFAETRSITVIKPGGLAVPADKNGEGILDPVSHLESYRIKRASGTSKHVKRTNVSVIDQFGSLLVSTIKEDRLLVPTEKDLSNPIPNPLNPASIDHFLCYKLKRIPGFQKVEGVSVADQFEDRLYDLLRPRLLCNAVDKNAEGLIGADSHLLCYKAKRAKGEVKHTKRTGIHLHTQFGPEQLDSRVEELLCVPAAVSP